MICVCANSLHDRGRGILETGVASVLAFLSARLGVLDQFGVDFRSTFVRHLGDDGLDFGVRGACGEEGWPIGVS